MSKLPIRSLRSLILQDLQKKMVFLGGPRQVGKTTLAQSLLKNYKDNHPGYLNWDSDIDRRKIRARQWPKNQKLIVLDEIHKFKMWRNFVKGLYDTLKQTHQFLITGSARLNHLRKAGDSLLGRYYYYRLHPFSLPEYGYGQKKLNDLFRFGGFPEPLLTRNLRELKRWHISRVSKLVHSDIRDLENIKDLDKMELLAEELPNRVGSPLSYRSLAEDLNIDPKTAQKWVAALDSLYYSFQIAPFGAARIRAVKKEQKLYLWDWSQIEDQSIRFENMIASQLLKYCHYHQDYNGEKMELRYIRDTDKREVDFVVIKNKKPLFAVESKFKNKTISPHIAYFAKRTNIPYFFQVDFNGPEKQISDQITMIGFADFCRRTQMI